MKTIALALAILLLVSGNQAVAGVIGETTTFSLVPAPVLTTTDPAEAAGVQAFNYFFTIEIFFGLVAVWVRLALSLFKREVL